MISSNNGGWKSGEELSSTESEFGIDLNGDQKVDGIVYDLNYMNLIEGSGNTSLYSVDSETGGALWDSLTNQGSNFSNDYGLSNGIDSVLVIETNGVFVPLFTDEITGVELNRFEVHGEALDIAYEAEIYDKNILLYSYCFEFDEGILEPFSALEGLWLGYIDDFWVGGSTPEDFNSKQQFDARWGQVFTLDQDFYG